MDNDEQLPTVASTSNGSPIKPNDVHVMLAKAIHRHKSVIINPSSSIPRDKISQEKERAWEAVRLEMVSAGIQRFATRTWRTVRDVDWQHLRRRVVNKITENLKLYQVANKDLNELDLLVLDTLGKTNPDGSIDYSDLIKPEPLDDMPKSVNSDKSENNYEPLDTSIAASTTNLLVEMIEEYGSNGKSLKRNSSPLPNEYTKKRNYTDNDYQQHNSSTDNKALTDLVDSSLMSNHETRVQWESLLRELGLGRNSKDEDTCKDLDQVGRLRAEQERYKVEAEKYRAEQERYKSLQERWKAEIEKLRLEEAKIRLNRLRKE